MFQLALESGFRSLRAFSHKRLFLRSGPTEVLAGFFVQCLGFLAEVIAFISFFIRIGHVQASRGPLRKCYVLLLES